MPMLLIVVPLLFGGPQAGPAGPARPAPTLTLQQAVTAAVARSPIRRAAEERASGARRAAELSRTYPNPVVEVRTENWTPGGWYWTPLTDPGAPPALDMFAVVAQPIELTGKRGARAGVARAEKDAAEADLAGASRALMLDTMRTYLDAVRYRELLRALDENRRGLDGLLTTMRSRVREGYAAQSALAKFQAESARVEGQLLRARIELGRNLARLGSLMGAAAAPPADALAEPAPVDPPAGDLDALVKQAVDGAPSVQAARARSLRATESQSLEHALRVPDLTVAGGYKRTAGANTAVLGATFAIPLFDRNGRNLAMATAEARAAALDDTAAQATAAAAARAVFEGARLLADRARRVGDELLTPAEIVRTAARSSFREGAADILSLVDAERVYMDAQAEALQLRLDATAAAIEARLWLGEEIRQ